jgi:hypothetical protein
LRPNFKQEKNTLHSLELFLDSPDVEKETLGKGIALNYFATNVRSDTIGVRFDLESGSDHIKLGYLRGAAWSSLLSHHLRGCDVMIAGFGKTNPNDYEKLNYNEECLGYFGTYSLLEEVQPRLFLTYEYESMDGDIRLEVVKKLRAEFEKNGEDSRKKTIVLPGDNGFALSLKDFVCACGPEKNRISLKDIHVARSENVFGKLQYFSRKCLI